jgi:hypothetical protein
MRNGRAGGFLSENKAVAWAEKNLLDDQDFAIEKTGGNSFVITWKMDGTLFCFRCAHKWLPQLIGLAGLPVVCPKCHSAYWNRPRSHDNRATSAAAPCEGARHGDDGRISG